MGGFEIRHADRLNKLPRYLFAEIDELRNEAIAEGRDVIDLGIGDPDRPTPRHIIDTLSEVAYNPENHRYPSYEGMKELREAFAEFFFERYGVRVDPEGEVLALIGTKEGICHIPLAFIDPGDCVLIPDPGYPVYRAGTIFAGGVPQIMPLLQEKSFLPDLSSIGPDVATRTKLMFLNYPNNPTSAVADGEFYREAVEFARRYGIILCQDAAYAEIAFDGYRPTSILQVEGAMDVAIEFHSLSKTFNMTGWRLGFAVGNREIVAGLGAVKTNVDSGIFQAIQYAGIAALRGPAEQVQALVKTYQERRDTLVDGLNSLGWNTPKPKAAFYVWIPLPEGYTSTQMTELLLKKAAIVCTPGVGFGEYGEGYIRMTLCVEKERLAEAVERISKVL